MGRSRRCRRSARVALFAEISAVALVAALGSPLAAQLELGEEREIDPEAEEEPVAPARVGGRVADLAGTPLGGVRVVLTTAAGGGSTAVDETDRRGRWSVLGVSAGRWRIQTEARGYFPADGWVDVEEGALTRVDLGLRSLEEVPPAFPEGDPQETAARWVERGEALLAQERPAEARADLGRALLLLAPGQRPAVLQAIARAHYLEGQGREALAALEEALRLVPADAALRQLYLRVGDAFGAAAATGAFLAALDAGAVSRPAVPPPAVSAPAPVGAPGGASAPAAGAPVGTPAAGLGPAKDLDRAAPPLAGHHRVRLPAGAGAAAAAPAGGPPVSPGEGDPTAPGAESFHLFVPEGEPPPGGWGLVVWVAPGEWGGFEGPGIAAALARAGLLWAGANAAGNGRPVADREALALAVATAVRAGLGVDPERVYAGGYSGGGRVAAGLATLHPEVFRGALCWFGVDHFHPVPVPDRPGSAWPARIPEPTRESLAGLRAGSRFVLVTGERDFNRPSTRATHDHLRADGWRRVALLDIPGADHSLGLDPAWFERALAVLDAPEGGQAGRH